MFARIAMASLCISLAIGCAKKPAKSTSTDAAAGTPLPAGSKKPGDKAGNGKPDGDKPNWLTDPRLKKDGDQLPVDGNAEGLPGKPGWGVKAPEGGWTPPNGPMPQPGGGANPPARPITVPAQPSVPPASPAAKSGGKPVSEADMKDIWIFIENRSGANGKMPASADVLIALIAAKSPAADLVSDGSITLTGATTRESVWAFETKARTQGGWAATQNGVESVTAAELARRLGRQD
jgi:hypothetical protein